MTLRNRNSNRSPSAQYNSWRRIDSNYDRHARLQRSLARLCSHPAVNPTGPHGPHGRVTSSPSVVSSCATYPKSHASTPNPSSPDSPQPSDFVAPGVVPELFKGLVHRHLGIHHSGKDSSNSLPLNEHLRAARAVTSTPSLSDPSFVARLATGHEPTRLADKKLLSSLPSTPAPLTIHSQRVRDIHLSIRNVRRRAGPAAKLKRPETATASPLVRRSSRKRLRSQKDQVSPSIEHTTEKTPVSNPESGELAAFRPTPDSVGRTRSEAARARRSSASKTPSECCFCPDPCNFEGEEIQSELIGPFVDRRGNAKLFVHFDCACWAPQVYADPANGQLRRVYDEYCRGRKLKCSSCGEKGATIGCYIQRCKRVFHYRCLGPAKAYCVERFFAAYCENHAHLGRNQSYRILMEAATIADVSAAQRREDTTYGLDAPHSRYTMLRRRETEIIFSRKWRVASHSGAFDTSKVIFSHRRKLVLGKTDRLSVGDCVRVLRASALDIASGRLAFMALAQKGNANDGVTAVEARAAIASRESTGLLLLRNLRKARQWGPDEIEVVQSIPMESKPSQPSLERRADADSESWMKTQDQGNVLAVNGPSTTRGKKRPGLEESSASGVDPDRKRQRLSTDRRGNDNVKSSKAEPSSDILPSVRLPSFTKNTNRRNMTRVSEEESPSTSHPLTQVISDNDKLLEKEPRQEVHENPESPKDPGSKAAFSSRDSLTESQELTRRKGESGKHRKVASHPVDRDECSKEDDPEKQKAEVKVKSAWETFLEEQLPKERLLRPDDSMPDSLRNMAHLWSLMTPAQRAAYEKRGRISSFAAPHRRGQGSCTARPKPASTVNAGLFSCSQKSHTRAESELKLQIKMKEPGTKRQPSVSLSVLKEVRRDERVPKTQSEQLDWNKVFPTALESDTKWEPSLSLSVLKEARKDDRIPKTQSEKLDWDKHFPTALESDLGRIGGKKSPQDGGKERTIDRVRAPPPPVRRKAGS